MAKNSIFAVSYKSFAFANHSDQCLRTFKPQKIHQVLRFISSFKFVQYVNINRNFIQLKVPHFQFFKNTVIPLTKDRKCGYQLGTTCGDPPALFVEQKDGTMLGSRQKLTIFLHFDLISQQNCNFQGLKCPEITL